MRNSDPTWKNSVEEGALKRRLKKYLWISFYTYVFVDESTVSTGIFSGNCADFSNLLVILIDWKNRVAVDFQVKKFVQSQQPANILSQEE